MACGVTFDVTERVGVIYAHWVRVAVERAVTATRSFTSTGALLHEVQIARIYGGMHFHHSIVQGTVLGEKVAHQLVNNYFQPVK